MDKADYLVDLFWRFAPPVWNWVLTVLNSNFSAACFGALGGSAAAYFLTRRAKAFDDATQEIRACNQGVVAAWNIGNAALNLKNQHIQELVYTYKRSGEDLLEHIAKKKEGVVPPGKVFVLKMDLRGVSTLPVSTSPLHRAIDHVSLTGPKMMMAITLAQCVDQLKLLITERNKLVVEFGERKEADELRLTERYFGIETSVMFDERFRDNVEGLGAFVDDCIFFSSEVAKAFTAHARSLRAESKSLPYVHELRFNPADVPASSNYPGWNDSDDANV